MILGTVDRCTSAFERNCAMLREGTPNNALNLTVNLPEKVDTST